MTPDPQLPRNLELETGPQQLSDIQDLYARLDLQNIAWAIAQGGDIGARASKVLGERLGRLALEGKK